MIGYLMCFKVVRCGFIIWSCYDSGRFVDCVDSF